MNRCVCFHCRTGDEKSVYLSCFGDLHFVSVVYHRVVVSSTQALLVSTKNSSIFFFYHLSPVLLLNFDHAISAGALRAIFVMLFVLRRHSVLSFCEPLGVVVLLIL